MSKIEVNEVVKQSGSTLTIGGPGTTVTLGSGASQTGFGRTGTVDWCTTAKTGPFTAVSGDGFFVNTTSGQITVTLPASPNPGDIVALADYANKWATNSVTICRNSSLINGGAFNSTLSTNGQSVTLIYVDGTRGWKTVTDSTANVTGAPNFIVATGGTIATCGDFKIHTFTSDGNFVVCSAPTPANNNVSYLVVAGGGAGANDEVAGGGGGAGGFREGETPAAPYTGSPLKAGTGVPVSVQAYPITVGAGGAGQPKPSPFPATNQTNPGADSIFSTITSAGGGAGGGNSSNPAPNGGSGGGATAATTTRNGGTGNTPPVSPPQGNPGGNAGNATSYRRTGGGGGATAAGENSVGPQPNGGDGGDGGAGATTSITGSPVAYAGGGGGTADNRASSSYTGGVGGTGGGGRGGDPSNAPTAGTANTGGGGGGNRASPPNAAPDQPAGSNGGSGIVVIRYKFQ